MTTTTPEIRVFIAPINQPTRGRWKDVGGPYIDENIREEMTRVREAYECLGMYDTGDLPSRYLDASAMARDLEASGDIHTKRLGVDRVAIFRGHI